MLHIYKTTDETIKGLADHFVQIVNTAIKEKGRCAVVLSGGKSPKKLYELLASPKYNRQIDWDKIYFFFGDERYVPMDSIENNYHMTEEYLFSKVPVNPKRIFPIDTHHLTARHAAEAYQNTLCAVLQLKPHELPVFDLVYLGLGQDAHTASLFPGTSLVHAYAQDDLTQNNTLVAAYYVEKLKMDRISLTPPAINHSKNIHFMISGEDKARAVYAVLKEKYQPDLYPAQLIKNLNGKMYWSLDKAAASNILKS